MKKKLVRRRTDTPENRAYWKHVEQCAKDVREMIRKQPWMRGYVEHFLCPNHEGFCHKGDGSQFCREVVTSEEE